MTLKCTVNADDHDSKRRKATGIKNADNMSAGDDESDEFGDMSSEEEIDDQTEALLKGFESEDDDENPESPGYIGQEIPKVDKKTKKKAKDAAKDSSSDKPGVIYVGRIPHGFYERQMKEYFSQFGDITNLRVSRSRKTGKSKHYAFVEFKSAEVAEIVSNTMDNYLLFNHILKCKLVAPEQVHEKLWIGANKRFKAVPWNKLEGRKLKLGMDEAGWSKRVEREEVRRANKKEAMKSMGYDFNIPKLKSVKDLPKKQKQSSLLLTSNSRVDDEQAKAIEPLKDPEVPALGSDKAEAAEAPEKVRKEKKGKKEGRVSS